MKPVVLELPESLERMDIHLLGDWHIGDPLCDLVSVAEKLDEIRIAYSVVICATWRCETAEATCTEPGYPPWVRWSG